MNEENERERRENDGERVNLEVEKISKEEVRENMKRMKNGFPVEVWKCLLRNCTTERWKVRGCWRDSIQFSRTRVIQSCSNYRGN